MNLKVSFRDTVTTFFYTEDCSPHCDVTAGVVVSGQPLSGKEVPQLIPLLLDLRGSKELQVRRC